jgi:porin
MRVSPNLEYVVNPDHVSDPFRTREVKDVFVAGLKFTIDVAI